MNTQLAEVRVQDGESIEAALRRFKREVLKAGIILEIKKRKHHESKRQRKKKSKDEAKRKAIYNKSKGFVGKPKTDKFGNKPGGDRFGNRSGGGGGNGGSGGGYSRPSSFNR